LMPITAATISVVLILPTNATRVMRSSCTPSIPAFLNSGRGQAARQTGALSCRCPVGRGELRRSGSVWSPTLWKVPMKS